VIVVPRLLILSIGPISTPAFPSLVQGIIAGLIGWVVMVFFFFFLINVSIPAPGLCTTREKGLGTLR